MQANWQLIATAPEVARPRVLLGWCSGEVRTGQWNAIHKRWDIDVEYAPEYMPGDLPTLELPPTHWQPLIPPDMIETPPIADPPKLIAVPFLGRWCRDGEHETRLAMSVPGVGVAIDVKFPWMSETRTLMVRWFVETLKMWPHPDAPVLPGEVDYPAYRQAAYARLFSDGDQKDLRHLFIRP